MGRRPSGGTGTRRTVKEATCVQLLTHMVSAALYEAPAGPSQKSAPPPVEWRALVHERGRGSTRRAPRRRLGLCVPTFLPQRGRVSRTRAAPGAILYASAWRHVTGRDGGAIAPARRRAPRPLAPRNASGHDKEARSWPSKLHSSDVPPRRHRRRSGQQRPHARARQGCVSFVAACRGASAGRAGASCRRRRSQAGAHGTRHWPASRAERPSAVAHIHGEGAPLAARPVAEPRHQAGRSKLGVGGSPTTPCAMKVRRTRRGPPRAHSLRGDTCVAGATVGARPDQRRQGLVLQHGGVLPAGPRGTAPTPPKPWLRHHPLPALLYDALSRSLRSRICARAAP
eukprot:scaffold3767_cov242-Prasinococcus_capsulatus_cf.AAC.6